MTETPLRAIEDGAALEAIARSISGHRPNRAILRPDRNATASSRPFAVIVDDQTEAIDFLSTAGAHDSAAAVRRIETHGAMVFLSGASAIKLKRAVCFGYMDYSTVAKRRAACEAEIRVNRRTAPSIYRRTRAIVRRPDGRVAWDGPGEILDWVVCMARFDENPGFRRARAAP